MANLPIITYPSPILQKKASKIDRPESAQIKRLIFDMLETLEANNGVGLAAPQVGKSLRLCVIKMDGKTFVLINPKIKSKSWRKDVSEEGCLSFPGKFLLVKRSKKVKVKALDEKGNALVIKADGLFSRVLQHEIDHLDGILYTKRKVGIAKKKK